MQSYENRPFSTVLSIRWLRLRKFSSLVRNRSFQNSFHANLTSIWSPNNLGQILEPKLCLSHPIRSTPMWAFLYEEFKPTIPFQYSNDKCEAEQYSHLLVCSSSHDWPVLGFVNVAEEPFCLNGNSEGGFLSCIAGVFIVVAAQCLQKQLADKRFKVNQKGLISASLWVQWKFSAAFLLHFGCPGCNSLQIALTYYCKHPLASGCRILALHCMFFLVWVLQAPSSWPSRMWPPKSLWDLQALGSMLKLFRLFHEVEGQAFTCMIGLSLW